MPGLQSFQLSPCKPDPGSLRSPKATGPLASWRLLLPEPLPGPPSAKGDEDVHQPPAPPPPIKVLICLRESQSWLLGGSQGPYGQPTSGYPRSVPSASALGGGSITAQSLCPMCMVPAGDAGRLLGGLPF